MGSFLFYFIWKSSPVIICVLNCDDDLVCYTKVFTGFFFYFFFSSIFVVVCAMSRDSKGRAWYDKIKIYRKSDSLASQVLLLVPKSLESLMV